MQATAKLNYARISPQKARLVVDLVRGRRAGEALTILKMTKKRAAGLVGKVLQSAIAGAEERDVDVDKLVVAKAYVNDGPRLTRIRPAPQGRAFQYVHRLCHIVIIVSDGVADAPSGEESEN